MQKAIEIQYLLECFLYNHESGALVWKERPYHHFKNPRAMNTWNARYSNKPASSIDSNGYVRVRINGKTHKVHRVAWAIYFGSHPDGEIDHIDGVKTHNQISNLRCVDSTGNKHNMPKQKNNSSGVTGVSFDKENSKWCAYISRFGKYTMLGRFDSRTEAISVRREAEMKYGYHENHGR
ncbi:HNH endonuclease signature motif containing protein [Yersinia enterocolitica]|uniref:HNH endonuclease signature motif containing protein n=1 Tax=Yersinia bercovieri TaxID=634 RepID=UPI0025AA672F|nr:HNH endonuclease signature motif containing protein [Yersinia bercovieri]MDN0103053.1 HNH endonuclease signature motif containing protein [Yersinia bercovieri]